ncbi:MAG: sodium-dependent bicarbonate transport family permease [Gammaproteobacteria bacterium]|nr:sodium-dependent bicarbonate transport family permease [Gammaproteobacteria bacterium]
MLDPIILFFLLGIIAGLARSELRLPSQIYDFVSILLLLAIGLKGGVELAQQPFAKLAPQILAVFAMGLILPLFAFPVLRKLGKFKRADAASIAAHYGSVSVGTYAVAIAYLASNDVSFEQYMPLLLVVLEVPAILVGILLARGLSKNMNWGEVAHEIFTGKGVLLLLGGLAIGWIAGPEGLEPIKPMFFDLFKGVLALFLLEMGLIAAARVSALRTYGAFLLVFGVVMPLFSSLFGIGIGLLFDLSVGGTTVLAVLAASASYIAVPAAMRISVPEANPSLSLTASLGITFPFNVLVGIPLYYQMCLWAHSVTGG